MAVASSVVAALIAYLRDEAAKKAGDKAAEVVGEQAISAATRGGAKALATVRSWFARENDAAGRQALAKVEAAPQEPSHEQELLQSVVQLAASRPAFAEELRLLAAQANLVQSGGVVQHISNQASNRGAQGVFNAPVSFGGAQADAGEDR
jgi:hypothetical protein